VGKERLKFTGENQGPIHKTKQDRKIEDRKINNARVSAFSGNQGDQSS
jgi:hypothetical protein